MKNDTVLATKQDLNPFTSALKARCLADGAVLVELRNGDFCKVVYKPENPDADESEAFHKADHSACWEPSGHSVTSSRFDIVGFEESPGAAPAPAQPAEQRFRHACWLAMQHTVFRYLMSNAHGRWDGAEKATRHLELCTFYVAAVRGVESDDVRIDFEEDFQRVHTATQELTDHLDEVIGFPLESDPDYDALAPKFFDRFHTLALQALA